MRWRCNKLLACHGTPTPYHVTRRSGFVTASCLFAASLEVYIPPRSRVTLGKFLVLDVVRGSYHMDCLLVYEGDVVNAIVHRTIEEAVVYRFICIIAKKYLLCGYSRS